MLDKFYIDYKKDENGKYKIDIPSRDIGKYYIKESNYLDKLSNYQTKVTAICPVLMQGGYGDKPTAYPMFWLNYDEISPYLGQTQVMTSSFNNTTNMSLDDYFVMRQYEGDIYKTSNLRNIPLSEYCETDSALQAERARIEKQLLDFQNGLWNESEKEASSDNSTAEQKDKKQGREPKQPRQKKERAPKAPRQNSSGGERLSVHR
jgi:gliding motility associated protien GldN